MVNLIPKAAAMVGLRHQTMALRLVVHPTAARLHRNMARLESRLPSRKTELTVKQGPRLWWVRSAITAAATTSRVRIQRTVSRASAWAVQRRIQQSSYLNLRLDRVRDADRVASACKPRLRQRLRWPATSTGWTNLSWTTR